MNKIKSVEQQKFVEVKEIWRNKHYMLKVEQAEMFLTVLIKNWRIIN